MGGGSGVREYHQNVAAGRVWRGREKIPAAPPTLRPMHYDAHQPIIADLEARILTIRDSL